MPAGTYAREPGTTDPGIVGALVRDRAALLASAHPGPGASGRLSDLTDRAVSALAETALCSLRTPWAVLALGGWGARRLLPASDLDILVITDASASDLGPAVSAMLYPLWDAGLSVGHQVRSARDHARRVRDDLPSLTSTLTGRVIAGSRELGERVLSQTASAAHRRRRTLLKELASRERPGSPYLLEPDLKAGAGGQRDLDELAWTAAVLSGRPARDHAPLTDLGLLAPAEREMLDRAGSIITTARWEVHARSPRPTSLLTLDLAAEIGGLAERTQAALADAHHTLLRVRRRVAAHDSRDGGSSPMSVAELAAAAAGPDAVGTLEEAAWSHRLDDLVPGMSDLMALRRPGLTHLYTVGAHAVRTTALLAGRAGSAGLPGELVRPLLVSGLLHDVGKVHRGPGHAARSARMTATLAPRFGLTPRQARDAETLVREHLLLSVTASTEDVHDEDVVLRVAGRLKRAELVAPLFHLVAADSEATGPGAWSPWTAALVGELAERVEAALAEEPHGGSLASRAESHRSEAGRLAATEPDEAVIARFVSSASVRYLASERPSDAIVHARLVEAALRPGAGPQVAVAPDRAHGTWRVSIALPDRPGLFAALAGAFALTGMDILAARAHAVPAGVALDVFVVRPDTLAAVEPPTWSAFERHVASALTDPRGTDARIAARRAHYASGPGPEPVVTVEPTGAYATSVQVSATDRVGVLHGIARAIEESGLDVRWAKVTTRGRRVLDVFHVVDGEGEPVDDPGVLGHLAVRIRERV